MKITKEHARSALSNVRAIVLNLMQDNDRKNQARPLTQWQQDELDALSAFIEQADAPKASETVPRSISGRHAEAIVAAIRQVSLAERVSAGSLLSDRLTQIVGVLAEALR